MHPETLLVSAARPAHEPDAPVNEPVHFSSTFIGWEPDTVPQRIYGRMSNPTWEGPERLLAALEQVPDPDAQPGLLFSSGMAALAAALHLAPAGGRVLLPRHAYQGLGSLAQQLQEQGRIQVEAVDVTDTAAVEQALQTPTALLWLESPTNPMLEIADLPALIEAAHRAGAIVVVDNTFATPLVQRPLTLGADVVVHSVTKYLAGHSDVVLGAALTADPELHVRLLAHRSLHGAIPGPMEAFLALRGMRTLALRTERSQATAAELARRAEAAAAEGRLPLAGVRYPGLPSHPQHALAAAQMTGGFGSVLTLEVAGGAEAADRVVQGLRLWVPATSLGGVESLAERRRRFAAEPDTVPDGLIRLSVGIEHVDDLWEDLEHALRAADAPGGTGR